MQAAGRLLLAGRLLHVHKNVLKDFFSMVPYLALAELVQYLYHLSHVVVQHGSCKATLPVVLN